MIYFILALVLLISPAHAEATRHCAVRSVDNVVEGCWILDTADYPPPTGTFWVPDQNTKGGPGNIWDGTNFIEPPVSPEEQAKRDADAAEVARQEQLKAMSDVQDLANRLKTATPAQIDTWVDSNVNNVAQARTLFKAILKLLAYSLRGGI